MRSNSIEQCCSSVSPTIFVDSFAFISLRRSIASLRSFSCVSYLSLSAVSASCFSSVIRASPFFSSSRSFSTVMTASVTASFCESAPASSLAFRLWISASLVAAIFCSSAISVAWASFDAVSCSFLLSQAHTKEYRVVFRQHPAPQQLRVSARLHRIQVSPSVPGFQNPWLRQSSAVHWQL